MSCSGVNKVALNWAKGSIVLGGSAPASQGSFSECFVINSNCREGRPVLCETVFVLVEPFTQIFSTGSRKSTLENPWTTCTGAGQAATGDGEILASFEYFCMGFSPFGRMFPRSLRNVVFIDLHFQWKRPPPPPLYWCCSCLGKIALWMKQKTHSFHSPFLYLKFFLFYWNYF